MGETASHQLREKASLLGALLNAQGRKESEAWFTLRGKLVEFVTRLSLPNPNMTTPLGMIGSLDLGYPEAEALLGQVMEDFGRMGADGSNPITLRDLILLLADKLSMAPLCDSPHKPMIDGDKFVQDNVDDMVFHWLYPTIQPYGVVSIVGAQSSGKSYLLNQLFGADFPVMRKKLGGWKQTTKGILMSRSIGPSLLIMDVEGFDGRERGEDRQFENQAALFALTISDLIMVNILETDISREYGGGRLLFETIFKERTKLPQGLTKMVVVLRRCDEETTSEILCDVIENMKKMWKSVHRKTEEATVRFEDYIEVEVVALPEKAMPEFQTKVTELRNLISKNSIDHNKGGKFPASSFTYSSKELWTQIKQNKRLDLPSIKVACTKIYCQQIVKEAMKSLVSHKVLLEAKESPQEFKKLSDTLVDNTIAMFDKEMAMYDEELKREERENLIDQIKKSHSQYSLKLMELIRKRMVDQFKTQFSTDLENMNDNGDIYYDVDTIVEDCKMQFNISCEDLKVFDVEYFHNIWAELQKELYSHTNYKMSELKEKRAKSDLEFAAEKFHKEKEELMKRLDDEKKKVAVEEINRLKEEHKKEIKRIGEEDEQKRVAAEEINRLKEEHENEIKRIREDVERTIELKRLAAEEHLDIERKRMKDEIEKLYLVVASQFSKDQCLGVCPEVSTFEHIEVRIRGNLKHEEEQERHARDHMVYTHLAHSLLAPYSPKNCIKQCIGASSTDNFPMETFRNTLEPADRVNMMPSYWSSVGKTNPDVPECLIYMLEADLCLVEEIKVQPYKVIYESGYPIYSTKFIRFQMGYQKLCQRLEVDVCDENEGEVIDNRNYVWTYTSPVFPLLQENSLQSFKLPRPVLCIGGIVKVELLGRVQKNETNGLYYINVSYVQIVGKPLSNELFVHPRKNGLCLTYVPGST